MLANIQRFFQEMLAEGEGGAGLEAPSLELAAAALLCEVMRADYEVTPEELDTLRAQLRETTGQRPLDANTPGRTVRLMPPGLQLSANLHEIG